MPSLTETTVYREVFGLDDLSSDFYDYLALCAPLFDVSQSFRGRLERKDPIHHRTYDAGINERAELV